MKTALMIIVLALSALAVYPLMVGLSVAIDSLVGDGGVYHYIFSSTNLRLSTKEVLNEWADSLVIAAPIVVVVFFAMLAVRQYRSVRGLSYGLPIAYLAGAFILGVYTGGNVLTGILYAMCAVLIGLLIYVAMRLHMGGRRDV